MDSLYHYFDKVEYIPEFTVIQRKSSYHSNPEVAIEDWLSFILKFKSSDINQFIS